MRIQSYEPNQVGVQESKGGHLDVRVPQENLASGLSQGIGDAATAIKQGVDEANRLRRTSLANDVLDLQSKLEQEATGIKGQDAADPARNNGKSLAEVYAGKFDEGTAKLLEKSGLSGEARAAALEDIRAVRRGMSEKIDGHTRTQLDKWKSSTYTDNIDKLSSAIQGLATMPAGPARDAMFEAYTSTVVATASAEAKRVGVDPAAAASAAKSMASSVLINTLLASEKDIDAKQVFDKAVASGALGTKDRAQLEPVINEQSSAAEGQRAATAAFEKFKLGTLSQVDATKEFASLPPKVARSAEQWFGHLVTTDNRQKDKQVEALADSVFNMHLGGTPSSRIASSNAFAQLKALSGSTADQVLQRFKSEERSDRAEREGREPGFADLMKDLDARISLNNIITSEPLLKWDESKLRMEAAKLGKKYGPELIKVWGAAKANPGKWSANMKDITDTLKGSEAYVNKKGQLTPDGAQLAIRIHQSLNERDASTGRVVHPSQEDVVAFTQRMAQQHTLTKGINMNVSDMTVVDAPKLLDADPKIIVGNGSEGKFLDKLWAAIPQPDKTRLWNQITSRPEWQRLPPAAKAATNNMVLRAWVRDYEAGKVKLSED